MTISSPIQQQQAQVHVEELNAWYGKKQALYQVSLAIAPLSVTAFIGPSGCGKSTFLRCLNRMHEEIAGARVSGTVRIDTIDIYARTIQARYVRRDIGMVFQQPNSLPGRSIWENVAIGARINGLAHGHALSERVEACLHQSALWEEVKDRLQTPATELSGGQQQRLCIARALAMQPQILLMDEPCSALDPESTFEVEELMKQLKEQYTVILVTHNMQQAGRVADHTVFFLQGRVIEAGETRQLFSRPRQKETEDYVAGRFS
jgi:phosphate transport system ATP-binding protein